MDSTQIREQLRNNVPPQMRDGYDRIVAAGMKFMFDKKTHRYMLDQMREPGDPAQKLGQGVAELLLFLFAQSKGALPQQLAIPAGIELVLHAAEFAQESGAMKLKPDTLGNAIQIMVFALFKKANMSGAKVMGMVEAMTKGAGNGPDQLSAG